MTLLLDCILIIIAIIVHEYGHYVAFAGYGVKPKITYHWWGIRIGNYETYALTPMQFAVVALSGVFAGFVPIFLIGDKMFWWMYLAACAVDMWSIFYLSVRGFYSKQARNMRILDIEKMYIAHAEKELGQRGFL